ncbi:GLPGLI family protein [Chryseobacterium sp.]|uniref:GLPGLI family protein n=1 Tax=Chryseobacterium sp. TaxID=1871047 RepID=UPI002FCBEDC4
MLYRNHSRIILFFLFFSYLAFAQTEKVDSLRGRFTYSLHYKPNKLNKEIVLQEFLSLQVSDDRAFFISENKLKYDSILSAQMKLIDGTYQVDMRNFTPNGPMSSFLLIQNNEDSKYYQSIDRAVLFYSTPVLKDWKLIDETKIINSVECKKAEIHHKGRDWIAWYATNIPFPYGPHIFNGLPGLIVKITDNTGDFDFELIKSVPSSKLKGQVITIRKSRYKNAKRVSKKELIAAKDNYRYNVKQQLTDQGTTFSNNQTETPKERQLRTERERNERNPIELED